MDGYCRQLSRNFPLLFDLNTAFRCSLSETAGTWSLSLTRSSRVQDRRAPSLPCSLLVFVAQFPFFRANSRVSRADPFFLFLQTWRPFAAHISRSLSVPSVKSVVARFPFRIRVNCRSFVRNSPVNLPTWNSKVGQKQKFLRVPTFSTSHFQQQSWDTCPTLPSAGSLGVSAPRAGQLANLPGSFQTFAADHQTEK